MVLGHKLSKASHFVPVKSTYRYVNIADIFLKEVFRLHDVSKVIASNRDTKFTGNFWKALFKGLGT